MALSNTPARSVDGRWTSFDLEAIHKIALAVRAKRAEWNDNEPYWSVGDCLGASEELALALTSNGYSAVPYRGYYNDCDETYPDILLEHSLDGPENLRMQEFDFDSWDGRWTHWWVVCGDVIVDITADQFHLLGEDGYEVVITSLGDSDYSMA
jgi:hypothetical protein